MSTSAVMSKPPHSSGTRLVGDGATAGAERTRRPGGPGRGDEAAEAVDQAVGDGQDVVALGLGVPQLVACAAARSGSSSARSVASEKSVVRSKSSQRSSSKSAAADGELLLVEDAGADVVGRRLPPLVVDRPRAHHLEVLRRGAAPGRPGSSSAARRLTPSTGCWATPSTWSGTSRPAAAMIVGMRSMAWANWLRTVPGSAIAPGPVHDQRRAGPAEPGVALPELVRRVAGPGPGPRVVVVGGEPAPVVVVGQVLLHRLPDVRGEAVLVEAARLAPLRAGPVVGEDHDEGVVQRPEALERREDAADLRVGVGQEAGEDLLLAGVHAPLVGRRGRSRPAPTPGARRQHGALGHDARGELAGEHLLAPGVPPLVEHAPVGVDPLGGHVVRGVHGAEREVQEEGLARRPLLLVLHHADGLVGQVLAEVVPLLGPARRLDVVVVADQVRGPVVGVALEEPVVALEAEARAARCRRARRPSAASAA